MARPLHSDKHIEDAIAHAENNGWKYKPPGRSAHCWGRLLCRHAQQSGCKFSIWSTPSDPFSYSKQIRRRVNKCPH